MYVCIINFNIMVDLCKRLRYAGIETFCIERNFNITKVYDPGLWFNLENNS